MRFLLVILLFFTCTAQAQITITVKKTLSNSSSNASSFGFPISFTAGKLYLWVATLTGAVTHGTVTSANTTWTSVASVGDVVRSVQILRFLPTTNVASETVSMGSFGGNTTGAACVVYEITGVPITGINGADAIVQAVSNAATGADPSIAMSALTGTSNAVISVFTNSVNPFGGTEESGWSEITDVGYTTPDNGTYEMRRLTTTDNTPTVTAASSDWAGIAIEIKSVSRRRIIID